MKILAIDTATEYCSAALLIDGELVDTGQKMTRGHSDYVIPMVDRLLADAGIILSQCDVVAFDRGPGSFTGIRIGVGVAQGLALGNDLPVISVSSLHALAMQCNSEYVSAAIDARMEQIYSASFKRVGQEQYEVLGSERVIKPEDISLNGSLYWTTIGSGWDRYGKSMKEMLPDVEIDVLSERYPQARDVAGLAGNIFSAGGAVAPEFGFPEYIRNQVTN